MNGLEKIIQKIENDSQLRADAIIASAQKEADAILEAAQATASKEAELIMEAADKKCKASVSAAYSNAQMNEKKAMLQAKNEVINDTVKKATEALKELEPEEYFSVIKALVLKYSMIGEGELRLSAKDLKRLPKDFEKNLNDALKAQNVKMKISNEPISTEGGCIIVYGDIEENCTFEALVEASLEEIKDTLYKIVF